MDKLFVYGTLRPGEPNEYLLAQIGGTWTKATLMGTHHESGTWLKGFMYPGIRVYPPNNPIDGYIFTSENLEENWNLLDQFEGEPYKRIIVEVILENNTRTAAYAYVINDDFKLTNNHE